MASTGGPVLRRREDRAEQKGSPRKPIVSPAILHASRDDTEWRTMDVYGSANLGGRVSLVEEADQGGRVNLVEETKRPQGLCGLLWRTLETPALLAAIGVLSSLASISISQIIHSDYEVRNLWVQSLDDPRLGCIYYTCMSVLLACLACAVTHAICPEAAGSGVPEMRVVLSGTVKPVLLSPRCLLAKACGLCLSLLAGLSVGKEGPFVHMACAIADQVMKLRCFGNVRRAAEKRLDILACACAAGVASTFGTPFGGALFSVEVTSNAYMVRNVARAAFCAVCGSLVFAVFQVEDSMSLFSENDSSYQSLIPGDLLLFAALGIVAGALGALFTAAVAFATKYKLAYLSGPAAQAAHDQLRRKVLITALGTALVAPAVYLDLTMGLHGETRTLTDSLFHDDIFGLPLRLLCYPVFKLFVTFVSVLLPLPVGLFTPVFLTGAAIGRVAGEVATALAQQRLATTRFEPWEFAVVGAAAFSTGVTRATSVAIIVFELSDEGHLRLPVALAVVLAYFVGQRFSPNVYDALADRNGTPYLPKLPSHVAEVPVHTLCRRLHARDVLSLEESTYESSRLLLRQNVTDEDFGVVRSFASMELVGRVLRQDLAEALQKFESTHGLSAPPQRSPLVRVKLDSRNRRRLDASVGVDESDYGEKIVGHYLRTKSLNKLFMARMQFLVVHDGRLLEYTEDTSLLVAQKQIVEQGESFVGFPPSAVPNDLEIIPLRLDPYPYQMVATTPLAKADVAFRLLRLGRCFITSHGKLYAVMTRDDLRDFIGDNAKKPIDRVLQILDAAYQSCRCCRSRRTDGYEQIV